MSNRRRSVEIDAAPNTRGSHRQRFQLSLRACIAITAVVAIVLGWYRFHQDLLDYRRQKLEAFENDLPDAKWVGRRMVSLECGLAGTNPELKGLVNVPELQDLVLWFSDVSDDRMERVARLPNLQSLDLMSTPISDTGLRHLRGMTTLNELNVSGTKITDESLSYIATMQNLHVLLIRNTRVTAKGLRELDSLSQLEELWLDRTDVNSGDVADFMRRNPNVTVYYQMPADFREPPAPTRISDLEEN